MRFRLANIRQAAHRPAQPRRVVLTHPVPRPGASLGRPAHRPQGQAPPGWPPASLDPGEPADHAQTRGGKREQNVHITTNAPPLLDEPFHIRTVGMTERRALPLGMRESPWRASLRAAVVVPAWGGKTVGALAYGGPR